MILIDMNELFTEPFVSDAKGQASKEIGLKKGMQVLQRNSDLGMEVWNEQIQETEIQLDKLSGLLIKLKDANEESKSLTKALEIKAIKKLMEKDIDDVGKIARNVKGKLEATTIDNILHRYFPGCQKGSAIDRARMNMTNALTKKLEELMIEFQNLCERIQDEYREVVERRRISVTGTIPDEMMTDHLIGTGNSEQIFHNTFEQMGQGQLINSMEDMQERYTALKEIVKRLPELHQVCIFSVEEQYRSLSSLIRFSFLGQIYLDVAVLVKDQARILDNIENQVTTGTDTLLTAKSLQRKSRNRIMITIILLLVIAIIIVLSVLKPWK
ncbi:syntaxin-132-like isoform X1 [Momordica charantia]|uniref:Syntaxin-132-like isoform X1 n=1 Tax=Momordica charantia TaxID=3673 RepID=A0A6J1CGS0_MOMCH|nr:syntaxin-132-like isoform X1 [Momordica charantia]